MNTELKPRQKISAARRWVVKVGSALLTNNGLGLDHAAIGAWVSQIVALQDSGIEVVLVSSGAVAEGMARLGWRQRPHKIHELQAAAAVGQMGLVQAYEAQFQHYGKHAAQVLLDHDDLANRQRYLNARSTLVSLLELGVIPVINENDTVATEEIRFGDNDRLAALVTNLVDAQLLVLLTDQNGLFEQDPRKHPGSPLISLADAEDRALDLIAGDSSSGLGRGGMLTKLQAARLAARSGANTLIAGGQVDNILLKLRAGDEEGTLLVANREPLDARKQWLAGHLQVRGRLVLDDGAVSMVRERGKSLLPIGVKSVSGTFTRGEMVSFVDQSGHEIARGLANYNADETAKIIGSASSEISKILGYCDDEELVHRDNLVLL
ncbi:MAG: glutamate 5-kinase [Gammaproteobacteria bacterium]|nr:MAG: glutamate 5-kinase [Gammaproteobacteria bacterium]RLA49032.1 MAG: glutamate 5-kinase [Gammaproteobacteria bacterium]